MLVCWLLLLSGCNAPTFSPRSTASPASTAKATMSAVALVNPGALTVASYTGYPPQIYIDPHTRQVSGFDADLIRAIGQRMGVRVDFVSVEFSSLAEYVVNEDVDLAISAIPVTAALQQKVQFVTYLQGGEALLVEEGNPLKLTSVNDLCGLSVGVKVDSIEQDDLTMQSETCQRDGKPAVKIAALSDQQSVIQLMLKKKIVAAYQDAPQADHFIKQYPGRFTLGGSITNVTLEGIAIRKDNVALFQMVQKSLDTLRKNGAYHALILKWGLIHEEFPAR
jgi:polar amino acid transport system substrate-binding protein